MINNLHDFVPPFTLYLNVENAQNPVQKHFEKTNNKILTLNIWTYFTHNWQGSHMFEQNTILSVFTIPPDLMYVFHNQKNNNSLQL